MTDRLAPFATEFPLAGPDGDPESIEFTPYLRRFLEIVGYDESAIHEDVRVSFDTLDIETKHAEYDSPYSYPVYVARDRTASPHLVAMGYGAVESAPLNLASYGEFREATTVPYEVAKPNLTVALTPFDIWVRAGPTLQSFPLSEYDPADGETLLERVSPPEELAE